MGSGRSDSAGFGDEEIVSSKSARISSPAMIAPISTIDHLQLWGHKSYLKQAMKSCDCERISGFAKPSRFATMQVNPKFTRASASNMDTPVRRPRIDPKFARYKLSIRKSKIHRYGVYAEERIPANRKVIEYTGERLNRRETKRRGEGEYTYLFTLDKYWTLDGAFGGSGAEIINHSCEPNVVSRIMKGHIIYMSLRTIKPGEEITVDYNFEYVGDQTSCACGANACRSVMERMTPKLERDLAKKKASRTTIGGANGNSAKRGGLGRPGANGEAGIKAKSKAAHV
jgi:hypothetical protein